VLQQRDSLLAGQNLEVLPYRPLFQLTFEKRRV